MFSSSAFVVISLWLLGWKPAVMFHVNGLVLLLGAWELSIVGVRGWAVVGFNGRSL